jgi:HD-like signal output (HDOD) protein
MGRICFVDDEEMVLTGLKRSLRRMSREWEMEFYSDPSEVLKAVRRGPVDVVVSDMRMPQLDGAALLAEIKTISPRTIRIILSGQADSELILRSVPVTHAYLDKPCDPLLLKATIERAQRCQELVTEADIQETITQLDEIPSLPETYEKVTSAIREGGRSVEEIGRLIAQDVGMSARLLQIANSAVFHFRKPVDSVTQAATLLGTKRIQQLVLSIGIFSVFDQKVNVDAVRRIWHESIAASALAVRIAKDLGLDQRSVDASSSAGMLHQCGRLVLLASFPQRYESAARRRRDESLSASEAERLEFGVEHNRIGAYVCSLWGLPDDVVDALASYRDPSGSLNARPDVVTALHVAWALLNKPEGESPDAEYIAALGLTERTAAWTEMAAHDQGEERF